MSTSNPDFDTEDYDRDDDEINIAPFISLPLDDQLPLPYLPPTSMAVSFDLQPPPTTSLLFPQDFTSDTPLFSDYNYLDDYPIFDDSTSIDVSTSSGTETNVTPAVHHQQGTIPNQVNMAEQGGVVLQQSGCSEASSSLVMMKKKKMDHNAKERNRRLQQNASYMALRSVLPETQKPKDKWSAPYIIDRTLEHIPQLECELQELKSKKKDIQFKTEKVRLENQELRMSTLTVSINEVRKGQVIIQICHQRHGDNDFSNLIKKLENEEGMEILGGSSSEPCVDRSCYNVHIQKKDGSSLGVDYLTILKEKVILCLT